MLENMHYTQMSWKYKHFCSFLKLGFFFCSNIILKWRNYDGFKVVVYNQSKYECRWIFLNKKKNHLWLYMVWQNFPAKNGFTWYTESPLPTYSYIDFNIFVEHKLELHKNRNVIYDFFHSILQYVCNKIADGTILKKY